MGPRPVGVTIVGILIVLMAIYGIFFSIAGFISGNTEGLGLWVLLLGLVVALIYLLVAKGIFNGNRGSRLVVAIFTVLALIAGIFSLSENLGDGLVRVLVSVLILALLYAGRAKEFFSA